MYSIYKITSPSGKYYIGLTKNPVKERWRQHVKRALCEPRNHPFYNAIRKYGPGAFQVETIDIAGCKKEAQEKEQYWIAQSPPGELYNLSPGGESDGEAGSKIFWDSVRKDPERLSAYLASLSRAKKAHDWSDYVNMAEKAAEWRKQHPKEAYKIAHRASRIAARQNPHAKEKPELPLKVRLQRKFKKPELCREHAKQQWANRTEEEVRKLAEKISASAKARWAEVTDPGERSKKTETARAAIDRGKQAKAASNGLKKYWEDLKADPERYRAYMERRTKSLNETIRRKKGENL